MVDSELIAYRINSILKEIDSSKYPSNLCVNWKNLSLIEIFFSQSVWPEKEYSFSKFVVVVGGVSPEEFRFSEIVEGIYFQKYEQNITIVTEW